MSSLQKNMLKMKFPGLPPTGHAPGSSRRSERQHNLTPATWKQYFSSAQDVRVGPDDVFHVYRAGTSGPLLLLLHGGGFSGLTWALFTERIIRSVECQVLAIDLRGHGETVTADESDLSAETLVSDVLAVTAAVFGGQPPPTLLVGHSMGGAIAVRAAHAWSAGPLVGLVIIDVVEGTAVEALGAMQTFLRGRPDRFHSVQQAIEWCMRSGAVRNAESARISVPGQLKNARTGVPATRQLELTSTCSPDQSGVALPAPPAADSIAEEDENEESQPRPPQVPISHDHASSRCR